jgi:hypothetical protein
MARWWWNGEGWENIFFKRVPTGWVFQAPSPWLFGRGRYYLASETQRAEIIAFFDHMSWRRIIAALLLATVVCGLMAPLALWLIPRLWNSVLLTMLPISIVGGSLINAYFWWTLRPLLAGVPQTTERITFTERLRALAAVVPVGQLILFAILLAVLSVVWALAALTSSSWQIDDLIGAIGVGLMIVYCCAMLKAKHNTTAGPWS